METKEKTKIHKRYNCRIYPTKANESLCGKTFGCCRKVYNVLLNVYETERNFKAVLEKEKTLKKEFPFLKEVDSISLQQSRMNLKIAIDSQFKKNTKTKKLNFKNKHSRQSYRTVSTNNNIKINFETSKLTLPILGEVRFRDARTFTGKIKQVTVSKSSTDKYYASILVEEEKEINFPETITEDQALSVDLGLTHFFTDSEGNKVDAPKFYRKEERKLKKQQRKLSRKKKDSNNRKKQRKKVAKIHEKVSNRRSDFLHKLSYSKTKNYLALGVEDLNISGMIKNHHLAKSIGDAAWGIFLKQLEYKSLWNGVYFEKINRFFPSSKICHKCDFKNKDLDLSQRVWTCPNCGAVLDRDLNAAINIKKELLRTLGLRGIYACGDSLRPKLSPEKDLARAESVKQEAPPFREG